ncbi:VIT domain-containing protein [Candidatus Venteria ishoeyi]|uniref:VIT domain-containing protein n=1 Tax=Candidatus Venteria ishoeyi TaxID=1899563 RepID=A0A1H6FEF1_9GAMM|nr:VIT domain-containing protein [Candidatus Venteria ishoeyi]SEH08458.1 Uncharacterised protein [Candidatus Venteria ishoeyi]
MTTKKKQFSVFFISLFGILLPIIALLMDRHWQVLTYNQLDSWRYFIHIALIACVPFANLLVMALEMKKPELIISPNQLRNLSMLLGISLGSCLLYSITFLPIMPFGVIAILFYGIGFLVLAPLFGLWTTLLCVKSLRQHQGIKSGWTLPGLRLGLVLVLLVYAGLYAPTWWTQYHVKQAVSLSSSDAQRARSIALLRHMGADKLLNPVSMMDGLAIDPLGWVSHSAPHLSYQERAALYFRVTGKAFDANTMRPRGFGNWDQHAGSSTIGGRIKGLKLNTTKMSGKVNADAGEAYLEWSFIFENKTNRNQEARAEIHLPPGAVVSRVTLWVNGEPREAAFAGSEKVRQAYQKVVQRNRDPLLVSHIAPDQILMQCFPVPPQREMKVRIGISVPLVVTEASQAHLRLPYMQARNFFLSQRKLELNLSTDRAMASIPETWQVSKNTKTGLNATFPATSIAQIQVLKIPRNPLITQAWAEDERTQGNTRFVLHKLQQQAVTIPQHLAIVVDGSGGMASYLPSLRQALKTLPSTIHLRGFFAGDQLQIAENLSSADGLDDWLADLDIIGGRDNVAALEAALKWAKQYPTGAVLWLHGPIPHLLNAPQSLVTALKANTQVNLYEYQMGIGDNKLLSAVKHATNLRKIAQWGDVRQDLSNFIQTWSHKTALSWTWQQQEQAPAAAKHRIQGSFHLARLWAYQRILEQPKGSAALTLASTYQLVTPISGAVVLENAQQYEDAKLKPVDATKVPSVPEPELVILLGVVLLLWLLMLWRRRHLSA